VLLSAGCGGGDERSETFTRGGWQQFQPGGKTRCARGDPYSFWLRRGDPRKMLVFFQGGGACDDAESCQGGFRDSVLAEYNPAVSGRGVLAVNEARNPFRDWSFVFIPNCTGDLHTGDVRTEYGNLVIEHRGRRNARAALERAFREFPRPETVLVAGCSAGGAGAAFHAESVIRRYPDARVAVIADSSPDVVTRAFRRWNREGVIGRLAGAYPEAVVARFGFVRDSILAELYGVSGGDPAKYESTLRAFDRRLKWIPNYRSYLACGDYHCALDDDAFFTTETDDVPLRHWVRDLAAGRDVDCLECSG
jgi:hypothetical protein